MAYKITRKIQRLGGVARAAALSKARRQEIAKAGATARWGERKITPLDAVRERAR